MAKETKQDRIVRNMIDQVTEHLHELKSLEGNPVVKEADVERWVQSFLKNCLGYTSSAGYAIRAQETKGKMRPDLIVLKDEKPIFVVEVKKLNFDLDKSNFRSGKTQLAEYLHTLGGAKWGMLTNGTEWKLFDFSQPQYGGIEISSYDLKSDSDTIELNKRAVEEQCYDALLSFHESSFITKAWEESAKEALAFSPESLAKAILSSDVVKYIAKSIKGEHEFRANHEVLTDRVYRLLALGLDDALNGWNEAKATDFQKYIKSQKRAGRKSRRTKKQEAPEAAEHTPSAEPDSNVVTADTKKAVA